jgi:uncharacterized heparinase superfamily protein
MNWQRTLAKLRWDGPTHLARRLIDRQVHRRATARRRKRWSRDAVAVRPADLPDDFSPAAAQRLWPGAAQRGWMDNAAKHWPQEHVRATEVANQAVAGRFNLLGSGWTDVCDSDGHIRWHRDFKSGAAFPADCLYLDVPITLGIEGSDIKVPWELSRFQHLFAQVWTQPECCNEDFLRHWEHWVVANPVARGVNWACAMDVALRAISWTVPLAAWGAAWPAALRRRFTAVLASHGAFIRDNLEWISGTRTNHYFSDIAGLAVLGAVLEGYAPATDWLRFAKRELDREILAQFAPDGVNRECSTSYHRLMLELATVAALALNAGGLNLAKPAEQRLHAAFRALATLIDAGGRMPLIGDNDSGRVFPTVPRDDSQPGHLLAIGGVLFDDPDLKQWPASPELALLLGPVALADAAQVPEHVPPRAAVALRDSGLFVLGRADNTLVVRCGPIGYTPSGTHRHVDQLSIAISVAGRQMIIDPGQFCYTPWPQWRLRFIQSFAHNTLSVDGEMQCRLFPLGDQHYSLIHENLPRLVRWESSASGDRFSGAHQGYRRLPGGADHVREIEFHAEQPRWSICDSLALRGQHTVTWRLHLHPAVEVRQDGAEWWLTRKTSKLRLRWAADPPAGRVESGWYAPAYGEKRATQVLVFEATCNDDVRATCVLEVG